VHYFLAPKSILGCIALSPELGRGFLSHGFENLADLSIFTAASESLPFIKSGEQLTESPSDAEKQIV
jgi:hypothetical protein